MAFNSPDFRKHLPPPAPPDEEARLRILNDYAILDTLPEEFFDQITQMAAEIFKVPIATVTFIDKERQWFKSRHGLSVAYTDRDIAFCAYAILGSDVMVVPDARDDPRFAANPLVLAEPNIRFYAGAPLLTRDGLALGTFSIIDIRPHPDFSEMAKTHLRTFANIVMHELEMRRAAGNVHADIVEAIKTRDELVRNHQLLETALRHAPITVVIEDRQLRFTWVYNPPLGLTSADMIGKTIADVLIPEDAAQMMATKRDVLESGRNIRRQMLCRGKNGRQAYLDYTLDPLLDSQGRAVGLIGIAIDVTEEVEYRSKLRRARAEAEAANRAKSQFLAAASHDLRQPFQAMRLFAHLLVDSLTDPRHHDLAVKMTESLEAGESLLNALLDISTLEAGTVKIDIAPVSLRKMGDRMIREFTPLANARGLTLRCVLPDISVASDPVLLERILSNLLSNALRYTQRGKILLGARRRSGQVRLQVWDTGLGIPEEEQASIFEAFYQLGNPERDRRKGLGLGLAIVKKTAELLSHDIGVMSKPGHGSVFTVTVPLAVPALPHRAAKPMPDHDVLANRLVLIVEDENTQLQALRMVVESWGCRVVAGTSPEEALAKLPGHRSPDLIISDFRLHGNHTGIEAISAVRNRAGQGIPGIIITGDTAPDRLREAKSGDFLLLNKPFDPAALRRCMERRLQNAKPAD